jgi:hypothetical protein
MCKANTLCNWKLGGPWDNAYCDTNLATHTDYPDAVACITANGYPGSLVSNIYDTNYKRKAAECKNDACIDRLKKTTLACYAQDNGFTSTCDVPPCPLAG